MFLPEHDASQLQEKQMGILIGEKMEAPMEHTVVSKDQHQLSCMIATNRLTAKGNLQMFQNVARDITEAKLMEKSIKCYLQEITRAQEEERKRIARELHDSTAQTLLAMMNQLNMAIEKGKKSPEEMTAFLCGIHGQLRSALDEVRQFSMNLRPSVLDDLGLVPALDLVASEFQKEHRDIRVKLYAPDQMQRIDTEIELVLFRIAQEALNNTGKHAHATRVHIGLESDEHKILLRVEDNGVGFAAPKLPGSLLKQGKLGLISMLERAQLVNGTMEVQSSPGNGTALTVTVPLDGQQGPNRIETANSSYVTPNTCTK